ncbi:MAG TPA: endonuclease III domain-containing protein [Firmicutes bacterium]|nr:endonuclease III domain-containing protein [Bacillota bacterium]
MDDRRRLLSLYAKLYAWAGPRHWWPAETPFEMIVGAILTQSVAWRNVVQAIGNLKAAGLLAPWALYRAEPGEIERCIVPTRYFRVKAKKLKAFVTHLCERYGGELEQLFARPWPELRRELLGVYGLGPETVDSILLYAGRQPVFVVDAYTRRIFSRLGLVPEKIGYQALQDYFMGLLPAEERLFNEYHAQLDGLGHRVCLAGKPRCAECPLREDCAVGRGERRLAEDPGPEKQRRRKERL